MNYYEEHREKTIAEIREVCKLAANLAACQMRRLSDVVAMRLKAP